MTSIRNSRYIVDTFTEFKKSIFYFNRFDDWQQFMSDGKKMYDEAILKYGNQFNRIVNEYPLDDPLGAFPNWITPESDTIEKLDEGFYTTFLRDDLLSNVILAFDEILDNIDMGGSFTKSKLIITDKTQGIFDFGLASLGLFEKVEFYSEELSIDNPLEFPTEQVAGLVPPMDIDMNELQQYFYTSDISGKKYLMTKQNKGTQAALNDGYSLNNIPLSYKSFGTKQKKSYLMFKKEGGKTKFIDLYVGVGGLGGMDSSGMLQRALPMFMAAKFFESVGIRTRINSSRMFLGAEFGEILDYANPKAVKQLDANSKSDSRIINCCTVVIKDFGEPLDFTRLAVAVADERTFRYNLWKYLPAINAIKYGVGMKGYGSTVYGKEEGLFEIGQRYKNWYREQIEQEDKEWVKIDKPLMIFGGVPEPENSWDYQGDKNERGYKNIVKEFYRILDIVDFTYNKPEKAAERIYIREVESGEKTLLEFKEYVLKTLGEAYGVAQGGEYADPEIEVTEIDIKFREKIEALNQFLEQKK